MKNSIFYGLIVSTSLLGTSEAALFIDFNSANQDGGEILQDGYEAYTATHEADPANVDHVQFGPRTYNPTFNGTAATVILTPTWSNTTDIRVQQAINRAPGNDANYTGSLANLVTDWIGIDTRTGSGGNGDFDGTTGTPTLLDLTLSGLPAGDYDWRSYHHDTENVWAPFTFEVSTDAGATFGSQISGQMTSSSPGGNPVNPSPVADNPATIDTSFSATGADVVLRFTPLSQTAVHQQLFAVNGFELTVVPEPSTAVLGLCGFAAFGLRRRR